MAPRKILGRRPGLRPPPAKQKLRCPARFLRPRPCRHPARAAISRNRAAVDDDRLKRDEDILGMVLQNRRVEV